MSFVSFFCGLTNTYRLERNGAEMKSGHRRKHISQYSLHFNDSLLIRVQRHLIQLLTPRKRPALIQPQPARESTREYALWLGQQGENYARWWLRKWQGMVILETNFRDGPYEIDIIARDGKVLVFVEVRTLSSDSFQRPSASITVTKQKNVHSGAAAWRVRRNYSGHWRIDIIGIVWPDPMTEPLRVDHWVKAF